MTERLAEMREAVEDATYEERLVILDDLFPKLIAYAEAVGEEHHEITAVDGYQACSSCIDPEYLYLRRLKWPCPTAKLSELLEGKVGE